MNINHFKIEMFKKGNNFWGKNE